MSINIKKNGADMENVKSTYSKEGVVTPLDILNDTEVAFYKQKILEFLDKNQWKLDSLNRHKPHIYLTWAHELARHPKIVDTVKQVLGEDVLCWYSVIFVKPPHTDAYVSWHQDSTYWALNEEKGCTVWLALSDVDESNGCVKYIPGSHLLPKSQHKVTGDRNNILHRGQEVDVQDPQKVQSIILKAGQASMHELRVLHMSEANTSDAPRLGIAFRYIPATNFPRTLKWLKRSALLVSGKKHHSRFVEDPVPVKDYDEKALRAHRSSLRVAAIHTIFGDESRSNLRKVIDAFPILVSRKMGFVWKFWKEMLRG